MDLKKKFFFKIEITPFPINRLNHDLVDRLEKSKDTRNTVYQLAPLLLAILFCHEMTPAHPLQPNQPPISSFEWD